MNQFHIRRSLCAIACIYAALIPPAQAGWIQDGVDAWNNGQQPDPYAETTRLQPISRDGFSYINQLGNGTDNNGDYRQPIRTRDAFGVDLPERTYVAPTTWDVDLSIEYEVHDGAIWNQRYQHTEGRF